MSTRQLVSKYINIASEEYVGRDGEIWIDISINLTHTGIHDFKGCYMSSLVM